MEEDEGSSKSSNTGIIIGASVGGSVLLVLLLLAGAYAFWQKKRADNAIEKSDPFGKIIINHINNSCISSHSHG